jgi:hypothetical protein
MHIRFVELRTFIVMSILAAGLTSSGCSIPAILAVLGQTPEEPQEPAVSVAQPAVETNLMAGSTGLVRWADIATEPGTVVNVIAQRKNEIDESTGDPITIATNRDALVDGDGDVANWDVTGVRVGMYDIIATISSPDGFTAEDTSDARFIVTTTLPVPTFTFTAPGATDVTFNPGDTFNFTWTDNGEANADAVVILGIDLDFDHDEGDEIILLRDQPLSADGNNGLFAFMGQDADGNPVAPNTYTVFATVDDGVNDPVTEEATGQLIVNP